VAQRLALQLPPKWIETAAKQKLRIKIATISRAEGGQLQALVGAQSVKYETKHDQIALTAITWHAELTVDCIRWA
jgi:hypothetical protein